MVPSPGACEKSPVRSSAEGSVEVALYGLRLRVAK